MESGEGYSGGGGAGVQGIRHISTRGAGGGGIALFLSGPGPQGNCTPSSWLCLPRLGIRSLTLKKYASRMGRPNWRCGHVERKPVRR